MFNFENLLKARQGSEVARAAQKIEENTFIVLVFGSLRTWKEIRLIKNAVNNCRKQQIKLLMAGRYVEPGSSTRQRIRRKSWQAWLRWNRAIVRDAYIPSHKIHEIVDAADVLLIPRMDNLGSGLVPLGMTFGKLVIAPDHGGYPDMLSGTGNIFYRSGDSDSLSDAIVKSMQVDRETIGRENEKIAKECAWGRIVDNCLAHLVDKEQRCS